MDVNIVPIQAGDRNQIVELCSLLTRSFHKLSPAWVPTVDRALEVVEDALDPAYINRILVMDREVVGWIGVRPDYGSVWELHPLVVDEALQRRGYGRALVEAASALAAEQGALTLLLGTSDEVGLTSLADKDLFDDPLAALQQLEVASSHPVGFWLKIGFKIVGVVPDAEGLGKPTILLAKSLARRT